MSLVDKLLAVDATKYKEKKTEKVEIKRLSKLIGEPFMVKVQEIDSNRMQEIQAMAFDKKGNYDMTKARHINLIVICEGIVEPSLSDKNLQKHFGASTPKELADTLFKGIDATKIADKIAELSNIVEVEDEEVKN